MALMIASVLAVGIAVFSVRNPDMIIVDLLVGSVRTSVSSALLAAASLGIVGGLFIAFVKRRVAEPGSEGKRKKN